MQCRLSLGIVKTLKESKQTWKLNWKVSIAGREV
jgi:hypothetical protein